MNWPEPAVVFAATLRQAEPDRRAGEIGADLRRWTGWPAVAAERFALDRVEPAPDVGLASVVGLGEWADARYFGGVAFHRTAARRVAVRWPPESTDAPELELLAAVGLRRWLAAHDGERLHLAVYDRDAWRELPEWGYHHMCG